MSSSWRGWASRSVIVRDPSVRADVWGLRCVAAVIKAIWDGEAACNHDISQLMHVFENLFYILITILVLQSMDVEMHDGRQYKAVVRNDKDAN